MIRVGETATVLTATPEELAAARATFQTRHHVRLPGFVDPPLLHKLHSHLRKATFVPRTHGEIGHELVCWDTPAADTLLFLLNDPHLFTLISDLTGVAPIANFIGRIYRMTPATAHHDMWHSDVGDHRLLALSLNLSETPYHGGTLLLRDQSDPETQQQLPNTTPGDAILFRIAPTLEHDITDVTPGPPKTAWAGWFRSYPPFRDVLTGKTAL